MKNIVAVIQPDRVDQVLDELEAKDIHLVTVSKVMGRGRQKGVAAFYRGHKEVGTLLRKVKIEVAVSAEFEEAAIEAICKGAQSGRIGDGKIFVYDIGQCVRIRTGERGIDAIG